jgi:hypothetical protein
MASKRKQTESPSASPSASHPVFIDLTEQDPKEIPSSIQLDEKKQKQNEQNDQNVQHDPSFDLIQLFESLRGLAAEELSIPDWEDSWGEVSQWPDESKPCYSYSFHHFSSEIKQLISSIELQIVFAGASLPKNLHEKYSKEIALICFYAQQQFLFKKDNKPIFKKCLEQFGLESFHWLQLIVYGCMNDSKKIVSDLIKLTKPLIKPKEEKMSTFCTDHVNAGGYMDPFITKMKNIDMDFLVSFLQATTNLPHNQALLHLCTGFSLPSSVSKALNQQ